MICHNESITFKSQDESPIMIDPEPLPHEEERLVALFRQEILDSPEETEFNEIVELAAQIFGSKISLISLVDDHRQWFKAKVGLEATETPKDIAFCAHAIHGDDIFEIPDATQDPRFVDNPLVTSGPNIRFYAGQPIHASDGNKLGTLCLIDDTPRQLTEDQRRILRTLARQVERQLHLRLQLRQQKKALQLIKTQSDSLVALNQIKDQLLSVLSHDLRSPLVMLEGMMDLFEAKALEPQEVLELMPEVQHKVRQTKMQLAQVLDWSQKQVLRQSLKMEPFAAGTILNQVLPWVKDVAEKKQVILMTQIESHLIFEGDLELVNLVLRNLLANAIKYSKRNDNVILFMQRNGDWGTIGVRDTGAGMKPETLTKLRSRHYQMSTPGTSNELGTGLGLLLCQTYLQQMGTSLDIDSTWKQGSTFSFQLPIANCQEEG